MFVQEGEEEMNKLYVNIFWTFVCLVILMLTIAMNAFIIPAILVAVLIGVWRFNNYVKYKNQQERNIPDEILEDWNKAERRYIESNGKIDPTTILWEIAKSKRRDGAIDSKESGAGIPNVRQQPNGRTNLSDNSYTRDADDKGSVSRPKANNHKRLFGRR